MGSTLSRRPAESRAFREAGGRARQARLGRRSRPPGIAGASGCRRQRPSGAIRGYSRSAARALGHAKLKQLKRQFTADRVDYRHPSSTSRSVHLPLLGIPSVKIFISYRRDDSADATGRLYDRLEQHYGAGEVFIDVDTIPLGMDFRKHLSDAVSQCDVLLAIIGERW